MSYQHMDHAAWVESNIAAAKGLAGKKRRDNTKGWAAAPDTLTGFQAKVFDILGMTFGGIYNAPICWDSLQWGGWGRGIGIPIQANNSISTFDYNVLTKLVFLCHEARIRGEIRSHGFRNLMLSFHPRVATGGMGERHPNLDEAVAAFREYLPDQHRIIYRENVDRMTVQQMDPA